MELGDDILLKLQLYLHGDMDETSRVSFESEISNSDDLQEFIALYKDIDNLEDDGSWNSYDGDTEELKRVAQLFRNKDTLEFAEKVKRIRAQSSGLGTKNRNPSRLLALSLIAACVAIVVLLVFPKEPNMAQLYAENSSWNELPSFVVKGDSTDKKRQEVEQAFEEENFEVAISLSESIMENTNVVDANMQLYNGIAHLELDQFDEALNAFDSLAESNSIDNHKGYWYTALVYLKQENMEETVKSLKRVIGSEGNYKYEPALKLLEELE